MNVRQAAITLSLLAGLFGLPACQNNAPHSSTAAVQPKETASQEGVDPSCAYFYFMWGAHAEISGNYPESLQAYQKALLCDPDSETIKNKIPILLIKSGDEDQAITYLLKQLKNNPEAINDRLILATLYLKDDQNQKAITLYEEILELDPEREDVLLRMGSIYAKQGETDKAERLFLQLIDKDSNLYFAYLYLARLYNKTNRPEEAEEYYLKAMDLNWSVDLVHEIGTYYKVQQNLQAFITLYEGYTKTSPYDELAQFSLIEGYLQHNQNDKAMERLLSMRNFSQTPYTIDLIISKIDISEDRVQSAITRLSTLLKGPAASEAGFLLAILHAQNEPEKALKYLKNIKNDFIDFENAVYLQAKLFKATDQIDQAVIAIQQRISNDKERKPSFYNILSALYQIKEQPDKAISTMEAAIDLYPENGNLLFELALLLEQEKQHDRAISTMEKVITLQPNNAEALNFVGYTWADRNIHLEKALEYIERAQKLKPKSGFIRDSLGWIHYRLGNLELAREHLEAAVQMEDKDPHIYDHLGDVYKELGRYTEATNAYSKALNDITDNQEREEILNKIESIKPSL